MDIIDRLQRRQPMAWVNDRLESFRAENISEIQREEVFDAEERLKRFAPLIAFLFPETEVAGGIIESEIVEIPEMQKTLFSEFCGKLYLKEDHNLPIAGSVKARGGIYEILKYAEKIALEKGGFTLEDSYEDLASVKYKKLFSEHKIQVGSTGNLGLSIGIISVALGFEVIVHMSSDAKEWKKEMLREKGAIVKEYEGDFSEAVEKGRKESDKDLMSYFVDDENSKDLLLGYAVVGKRLYRQLEDQGIIVDKEHPLFVYLPCGVGGGPAGITYGLKCEFGDNVHVFLVEPIESPSMLLGLASGQKEAISVKDIGLSGKTEADGLAVGRPSRLASDVLEKSISGVFTVLDEDLYGFMKDLYKREEIFVEPSGCAAFEGPLNIFYEKEMIDYLGKYDLMKNLEKSTHIAWATGGSLVPEEVRRKLLER